MFGLDRNNRNKIEKLERQVFELEEKVNTYEVFVSFARDCHGTRRVPINEVINAIAKHIGMKIEIIHQSEKTGFLLEEIIYDKQDEE